ncbi:androgen-induced gene 1 protein isoform X7 [Acinonyx jubatus]|uniref:Androgen-induced gene 1 protein isoform X7 n=1 Tax=Acinonyx jubatus TaxID=32536 RepID=A0A6J1Z692_ACIJB|nr:androgen-induced gene 1 protein isoform X7 [Acinonyx jubatus]
MALVPCQVLRVAILLSYCSILCNYKAIEMPSHQTYGGSWKFLTFIDLVIQAVFFGICVLTDLSSLLTRGSGNQEQERQLKKLISLRDWMLAVLAFPVGVFVVAVFWIIYAYDREMIYPKLLDNFIPGWLNHGMGPKTNKQNNNNNKKPLHFIIQENCCSQQKSRWWSPQEATGRGTAKEEGRSPPWSCASDPAKASPKGEASEMQGASPPGPHVAWALSLSLH